MNKHTIFLNLVLIVMTLTFCYGSQDVNVSVPFDFDRYEKEGEAYLEKYTEYRWGDMLDTALAHPHPKNQLNYLKKRFGEHIVDIAQMYKLYGKPYEHHVIRMTFGAANVIDCHIPIGGRLYRDQFSKIPECFFEEYVWEVENGYKVVVAYIRRGKTLIPFIAWYYGPNDLLPE